MAFVSSILVVFTVQETVTTKQSIDDPPTKNAYSGTNSKTPVHNNIVRAVKELTPYAGIFIGLCVARFILAFSTSLMQPVLSVYANEEIGISEMGVGMLFTVQGIVTLFATMPMATIADRVGRKPMIVFGTIIHASAAILVIFSGSLWPLLLVMTMRGYGRAVSNPSITAMFSGLVPISNRGKGMGIFNIFQNVGLVVGATVGGFLYEFSSSEAPFIACAGVGLIGVLVVLLMVSEPKQGLR